jgi:hypothetical protein
VDFDTFAAINMGAPMRQFDPGLSWEEQIRYPASAHPVDAILDAARSNSVKGRFDW